MKDLDRKLNSCFPGKVVRKDLTKKIKEYNVGFWSYTLDFSICEDCAEKLLNIKKHITAQEIAENKKRQARK